jgi:hypothetical protein
VGIRVGAVLGKVVGASGCMWVCDLVGVSGWVR